MRNRTFHTTDNEFRSCHSECTERQNTSMTLCILRSSRWAVITTTIDPQDQLTDNYASDNGKGSQFVYLSVTQNTGCKTETTCRMQNWDCNGRRMQSWSDNAYAKLRLQLLRQFGADRNHATEQAIATNHQRNQDMLQCTNDTEQPC